MLHPTALAQMVGESGDFVGVPPPRGRGYGDRFGAHRRSGDLRVGDPEQLVDFAYRSAHEMTLAAKTIVTTFYGSGPRLSYWDGRSTGGRMALTEAQRFPENFDGIIAGAPANFSSHQAARMMSVALAVHPPSREASADEASYIPPAKYPLSHQAVVEACDARDGVKDGVLEDPVRCDFDPRLLECKGEDAATCLTPGQVSAARKIYSPIVNPRARRVAPRGLGIPKPQSLIPGR
jgi:feruloyl esterase